MKAVIIYVLLYAIFGAVIASTAFTQPDSFLSGTTVVAIRNDNQVTVGADSKGTWYGKQKTTQTHCKIRQTGSLFYAFAMMTEHPQSGYSIPAIVNQVSQSNGSILQKAAFFENIVRDPIIRALEMIRRDYPDDFKRKHLKDPVLQIIFFGFEVNAPVLLARQFRVNTSTDGSLQLTIDRNDCPGMECPKGLARLTMGEHGEIDRFLKRQPDFWKANVTEGVKRMIQLQIDATPDKVGGPIDLIVVDGNGGHWLQRRQECFNEDR